MRLALLIFRYGAQGGLARACAQIADQLHRRGHEVVIFAGRADGTPPPGVMLRAVTAKGLSNHGRNGAFMRAVRPLLAAERLDGVIGFNRMPGLDVYYAGDSCFRERAVRHGALYRLTPRYRAMAAAEAAVFGAGSTAEIVLQSEPLIAAYRRHYATPAERFHLVPPGVPEERRPPADAEARRAALRRELGIGDDDVMLLMVAADLRTKGIDRSLRAIAALPAELRRRVRLVTVGDADAAPYRRLARRLGLAPQVTILPGRADVVSFYSAADLFLNAARDETAGVAILEAVINGVPVLCTANCGFAPHVEQARAGRVLPEPFRQAAMDAALLEMLRLLGAADWRANGLRYGTTADLYRGRALAAEIIESLLRDRASASR